MDNLGLIFYLSLPAFDRGMCYFQGLSELINNCFILCGHYFYFRSDNAAC